MNSLYDRADIYDMFEDEKHHSWYKKHWENVLKDKKITSMLDVSIGSGSVTLPTLDLEIELQGSDLSETMLANCEKKARAKGISMELNCSDFRDLSCWGEQKYDCVASTGNSLPHVNNADVLKAMGEMDRHVKDGGYLYLDMRNWDKIQIEHNRFFLYNPVFLDGNRINLIQVWDYNQDDTMTFNLLYTFEKDNQIFQKEKFEELYYPIKQELILGKLKEMGYGNIEIMNFPAMDRKIEIDDMDWYCVVAQKER